jgi:hypothetical protein
MHEKMQNVLRPQFKMSTKGPEINSEGGVHVDLETTGNGQKEPAFDTFCVGGTKEIERSPIFIFLCPPHRRCQMPAPFDDYLSFPQSAAPFPSWLPSWKLCTPPPGCTFSRLEMDILNCGRNILFIVAQKRAETNYSKTVTRTDMVWDPYLENRFRKKNENLDWFERISVKYLATWFRTQLVW